MLVGGSFPGLEAINTTSDDITEMCAHGTQYGSIIKCLNLKQISIVLAGYCEFCCIISLFIL